MEQLAAIVDVMWGGEVVVGPTFSKAVCLEGAPKYIEMLEPERRAVWQQVFDQARANFPAELYGEKFSVLIIEYDDGTVKAITYKNYLELQRRTNAQAYQDAVNAAIQDGAAPAGGDAGAGGATGGDGTDGAVSG